MKPRHAAALAVRPSNVVWFEKLMYFTVALEVISTIWRWDRLMAEAPRHYGSVAIATVLGILTDVLFIWLVARRRKGWVRWLMLPPVVIGIPWGLLHWSSAIPVFDAVLTCLFWLASTVALYLIFTGNSREWFVNDPVGEISSTN